MSPITTTTEINRPATDVYQYATDPTRFKEWQQGVVEGHMDHAGTSNVGDLCITTRRIGGANRSSTSRLTHIDAPRTWGIQGTDGPIRATVDLIVAPLAENRARLTIAVDFEGRGVGKILVPLLVRRQAQKEMPGNLATLKQRLENTAPWFDPRWLSTVQGPSHALRLVETTSALKGARTKTVDVSIDASQTEPSTGQPPSTAKASWDQPCRATRRDNCPQLSTDLRAFVGTSCSVGLRHMATPSDPPTCSAPLPTKRRRCVIP